MFYRPVLSSVSPHTLTHLQTILYPEQKLIRTPTSQAFRQAARPAPSLASRFAPRISPIAARFLSAETKQAIDKAVASAPVVLFMKGTPETPQCGFSRASIQILGLQGVDPAKFTAFNVLEDEALRQGNESLCEYVGVRNTNDGVLGIKEYSEWPTIPQLYLNKEFVGGCDILVSMHQNGELAKMLEEKKVLIPAEGAESK
jgi:monothiol glutaredoxin